MNLLLDCDAGGDDALALHLLCRSEHTLLGVSTCFGGLPPQAAAIQAQRILISEGKQEIAVCAGAKAAIGGQGAVHGENAALWQGAAMAPGAFLQQILEAADAPVTLLATAPLTNVAAMLQASARWPERIIIMGGGIHGGNRTAAAEFNFWCDPEAAELVLQSGCPITLLPIEAARDCVLTASTISGFSPAIQSLIQALMAFSYRTGCGNGEAAIAYDAVAAAGLIDAAVFSGTKQCTCRVAHSDTTLSGALSISPKPGNVTLVEYADPAAFFSVLFGLL